jgi:hypothetical protein
MAAEIITKEDLQQFRIQLLADLKDIILPSRQTSPKPWLKSSEVKKLLGVGDSKLQMLRTSGRLASSKLGGVRYFKFEDIKKMLESGKD